MSLGECKNVANAISKLRPELCLFSHPDPTQRLEQDENVNVKIAIITSCSPITTINDMAIHV
jgi:hypothetical protein